MSPETGTIFTTVVNLELSDEQRANSDAEDIMVVVFTIFNLVCIILYLTKIILYVNYDGSRCNTSILAQA